MLHKKIRIPEKKTIALMAHDHKKSDPLAWICENKDLLKNHSLLGTSNTASLLSERTDLKARTMILDPLDGGQQISAMISENEVDILISFWDPLETMPHDPGVKAPFRIFTLCSIALATYPIMANYLISSPPYRSSYRVEIVDNGYTLSVGHRNKKKS